MTRTNLLSCFCVVSTLMLGGFTSTSFAHQVDRSKNTKDVVLYNSFFKKEEDSSSDIWLQVRLSERKVYLMRGDKKVIEFPVAVGRDGWETPIGEFYIIELTEDPWWEHPFTGEVFSPDNPNNPIQNYWIAFTVIDDLWYGFHGTNDFDSVGQAISHGCLRMYDEDIALLFSKVSNGTRVQIIP